MDVRAYLVGAARICGSALKITVVVCAVMGSNSSAGAAQKSPENDRTVRVESGVAYFRRPGKMRWEYAAPESNLFLIDGKMAWFYVPADHTVTRVPAKQSTDWRTPLALLAGETKEIGR